MSVGKGLALVAHFSLVPKRYPLSVSNIGCSSARNSKYSGSGWSSGSAGVQSFWDGLSRSANTYKSCAMAGSTVGDMAHLLTVTRE